MGVDTDTHVTQDIVGQNPLADYLAVNRDHGPSGSPLMGDLPHKFDLHTSDTHANLVTDGDGITAHEGQSTIDSFTEPSDTQTAGAENGRTDPPSKSDQGIVPVHEEAPYSKHAFVHENASDAEEHTIVHPPELPPLLSTISAAPQEESKPDSDERLNCIRMSEAEIGHVDSAGLAHLSDEEETGEDFDNPCDDIPSIPPSSSPPQLFSSSPCASSQSSVSDAQPTKMVSTVDVDVANCHDGLLGSQLLPSAQDESCSELENFRGGDDIDVTPSETDACGSNIPSTPCADRLPVHSKRQMSYRSDPNDSYGSQPTKRPKLGPSSNFLLPAPKRATLASQHRQFKKLITPFRPPMKLPAATDGPVRTTNDAKTTMCSRIELSQDNPEPREPTTHTIPLQHKTLNTPKSISQFKSPLVNRVLPADARTIRLTPAVQALERKLQLLKRAVKVKEDNEEDVLGRLAGKWMEAGREVAYEVWDAVKEAGDFEANTASANRSYGWESTDKRNVPWGWDNKPGDAGRSDDCDSSEVSYAAGRPAPEEDDDGVGSNTLGTMLRQLGIAPEIFGWDDDKETFAD